MYNFGLTSFCIAKEVKLEVAVTKFLQHCGITEFSYKNHSKADRYIKENWNKFANFIDKAIKNGQIKGKDVKLNSYYDELNERRETINNEFAGLNLTNDELKVLDTLASTDRGIVHSFISKQKLQLPKNDYSWTSKKLQMMPIIELLRENNIVDMCVVAIETKNTNL